MNCIESSVNKLMSIETLSKLLKSLGNNTDVGIFAPMQMCYIQSITDPVPTPLRDSTMVDLNMRSKYNPKYKFYLIVKQQ